MIVQLNRRVGDRLEAGPGAPTRVMGLVGLAQPHDYDQQVAKIDALVQASTKPDIIADLSITRVPRPLWSRVLHAGLVASTLPVYTASRSDPRIDQQEFIDIALEHMAGGVGVLTIHPTPTRRLFALAQQRRIPCTSRGGALVIADLLSSSEADNVCLRSLPVLLSAAKRHGTVLSLGASFRAASIEDTLDPAQLGELESQITLARSIHEAGVGVIIESPGHARPRDIQECARRLAATGFPIMPLGPIPTDSAVGQDHIAGAIGATLMGMQGAAHILVAVTREEHTGGIPSLASTFEAIEAVRVAAKLIDIHQLDNTALDAEVTRQRAERRTCVAGKATQRCGRCGASCPLASTPSNFGNGIGERESSEDSKIH